MKREWIRKGHLFKEMPSMVHGSRLRERRVLQRCISGKFKDEILHKFCVTYCAAYGRHEPEENTHGCAFTFTGINVMGTMWL